MPQPGRMIQRRLLSIYIAIGILGAFCTVLVSPFLWVVLVAHFHNLNTKADIRALNRAQTVFFREHERFAESIQELDVSLRDRDMVSSVYSTHPETDFVVNFVSSLENLGTSHKGAVKVVSTRLTAASTDAYEMVTIICAAEAPEAMPNPRYEKGQLICGEGTIQVE